MGERKTEVLEVLSSIVGVGRCMGCMGDMRCSVVFHDGACFFDNCHVKMTARTMQRLYMFSVEAVSVNLQVY